MAGSFVSAYVFSSKVEMGLVVAQFGYGFPRHCSVCLRHSQRSIHPVKSVHSRAMVPSPRTRTGEKSIDVQVRRRQTDLYPVPVPVSVQLSSTVPRPLDGPRILPGVVSPTVEVNVGGGGGPTSWNFRQILNKIELKLGTLRLGPRLRTPLPVWRWRWRWR